MGSGDLTDGGDRADDHAVFAEADRQLGEGTTMGGGVRLQRAGLGRRVGWDDDFGGIDRQAGG